MTARGGQDGTDELALLARVAAGDQTAFEALYRVFHPRLWRFLERLTRRPHLVDESLNDTMLVVWNKPHSYNGECKLSTWIFAIAFNKAMKALHRSDDPVAEQDLPEQMSEAPGPEGELIAGQRLAVVLRAVARLPAEQRAVVELSYFHEFGYREIAEVMSCPVDTVKTRMFHARRKLRRILGTADEDMA